MPIRIITTGSRDCPYFNKYLKRIVAENILLPKKLSGEAYLKKINMLSKGALIIFDENGKQYTSNEFSQFYKKIIETNHQSTWVCGPADGIKTEFVQKQANYVISLSNLTFPHDLARILVIEQLYRAQQILNNHPYHRD